VEFHRALIDRGPAECRSGVGSRIGGRQIVSLLRKPSRSGGVEAAAQAPHCSAGRGSLSPGRIQAERDTRRSDRAGMRTIASSRDLPPRPAREARAGRCDDDPRSRKRKSSASPAGTPGGHAGSCSAGSLMGGPLADPTGPTPPPPPPRSMVRHPGDLAPACAVLLARLESPSCRIIAPVASPASARVVLDTEAHALGPQGFRRPSHDS
jgi:hypothetical protein